MICSVNKACRHHLRQQPQPAAGATGPTFGWSSSPGTTPTGSTDEAYRLWGGGSAGLIGRRLRFGLAQCPERRAKLFGKQLWLFPGGEVAALGGLVEVDQVVVRA